MRIPVVALSLLCAAVLFVGLGGTGFLDAREARDAQVGRELAGARNAITPVLGSEPLFEKPILAYVADAAVRALSHRPEFDSRLVRGVIAMLLIAVTASVAAANFGARAGWFSAGVLVTTMVLPQAARVDGGQLLATLLAWLGIAGLSNALFVRHPGRQALLALAYAALGLALLAGGPASAAWPFAAIALYGVLGGRRDLWRRVQPLAGLALMAGLALPWYGAMIVLNGGAFLRHVAFFPYAIEPRGPLLIAPVALLSFLVIGMFPWSTLLPGALLHAATWWRTGGGRPEVERALEAREENAAHFFIACLVASLAPVLLYPTPPLTAVLPAAPAVAILCGRLVAHAYEDAERVAAPIARAVVMLALLGTMTAVMLALAANTLREVAGPLRLLAAAVLLTSWAPFLANLMRRRLVAVLLMLLPIAVAMPIVALRVLPAMEGYLSTRPVARAMEEVAPPRATLLVIEPPPATLRLYGEHNLVLARDVARDAAATRATDGLSYLAFRPARERDVVRALREPVEILLRTPALVLARVRAGGV